MPARLQRWADGQGAASVRPVHASEMRHGMPPAMHSTGDVQLIKREGARRKTRAIWSENSDKSVQEVRSGISQKLVKL